jgi:flagellar hook protein FlgE
MSFNIALTGLNAVNEQLNAVSNNIANSGTTGFKSSRAEFGSIYSDTMAMGVETIGLTQSISQGGSLVTTDFRRWFFCHQIQ